MKTALFRKVVERNKLTTGSDLLIEHQLELQLSGGRTMITEDNLIGKKGVLELADILETAAEAIEKSELKPGETFEIRISNVTSIL